MSGDAVEYKNGQKNNWRLHLWNRISEVVQNKRDSLVIYLPGEKDLDSFVAQRKGFRSANLIAVENNEQVVKALRVRKRTVIHDDLLTVMLNWPAAHGVGVVLADLQHGCTKDVLAILTAWCCLEAFRNSVLLVNMQRGRESQADAGYQAILRNREFVETRSIDDTKNRALMLLPGLIGDVARHSGSSADGENACAIAHQFIGWRVLPSYRSTPKSPMFDSFLVHDYGLLPRYESAGDMLRHVSTAGVDNNFFAQRIDLEVRQRIAAALAVRRMRLDGRLNCA